MRTNDSASALNAAVFAIFLGLVSGLSCAGVRLGFRGLQWLFVQHGGMLPDAAAMLSPWRRILTPAIGALLAMTVLWIVRRYALVESSVDYVEAVRLRAGRIPFAATAWRTLSSAFSIATGAAIGREGSMIQFSAAVTSRIAERLPIGSPSLPVAVSCGAAAAVAAAYQAPIAGIFFAAEIVLGEWQWAALPNLALASVSGWFASRLLLEPGPLFLANIHSAFTQQDLWALPLALLLGMAAPGYQALLRTLRFTSRWPLPLLWSGLAVGALSLLVPEVWGNGDAALTETLKSPALPTIGLVLITRLIATIFCTGSGTVGGVFTPTLFTGAALGLIAGHLTGAVEPSLLAVVGMSTLLAAVTHAPLMAAFMSIELTGQWHLCPLLLALNLASYAVARRLSIRSLYAIATPVPTKQLA